MVHWTVGALQLAYRGWYTVGALQLVNRGWYTVGALQLANRGWYTVGALQLANERWYTVGALQLALALVQWTTGKVVLCNKNICTSMYTVPILKTFDLI